MARSPAPTLNGRVEDRVEDLVIVAAADGQRVAAGDAVEEAHAIHRDRASRRDGDSAVNRHFTRSARRIAAAAGARNPRIGGDDAHRLVDGQVLRIHPVKNDNHIAVRGRVNRRLDRGEAAGAHHQEQTGRQSRDALHGRERVGALITVSGIGVHDSEARAIGGNGVARDGARELHGIEIAAAVDGVVAAAAHQRVRAAAAHQRVAEAGAHKRVGRIVAGDRKPVHRR